MPAVRAKLHEHNPNLALGKIRPMTGYVERAKLARTAGDDWWVTTVKGNALANASFGKPVSRATAARLLTESSNAPAPTTPTPPGS